MRERSIYERLLIGRRYYLTSSKKLLLTINALALDVVNMLKKRKKITDRQHVTTSTQRYRLLPLKTQKALFCYIFLMHIIVLQLEIVTNSIVCILAVRFKLEDCYLSINTMCLYENPTPFWLKIWAKRIFE